MNFGDESKSGVWKNNPKLKAVLLDCISRGWSAKRTAYHLSSISGLLVTKSAAISKSHRLGLPFNSIKPPITIKHLKRKLSLAGLVRAQQGSEL